MGDGDVPAPRPCPGIPRERERRWGVWWDALARGVGVRVGARSRGRAVREPPLRPGGAHEGGGDAGAGGVGPLVRPFDRLRANGLGLRPCDGVWGMRWGTETPRAAPLWIPAFAGMTRVVEAGGGGGPLRVSSGQASTGLGRMDWGSACATGCWRGWGRDGGWLWGAVMLLGSWLRWKSSGGRRRDGALAEWWWRWRSSCGQMCCFGAVGCLDTAVWRVLVCCIWTQHLVYG